MLKHIFGIIRLPFLLLVPACLAPALAVAYLESGALDCLKAALVLVAAVAGHVAVNALNEYDDFKSGLDFATTRTPFSGGSGALVAAGHLAPVALYLGLVALLVTFSIGVYFAWNVGGAVIIPGLLGLTIIVTYTRWLNRLPLLCLLAPGVGFGVLMVNLTVLVLAGRVTTLSVLTSIPVACVVSNLLLLNQFPDAEADRRVGRHHVVVAWGTAWGGRIYLMLMLVAYGSIVSACLVGIMPFSAKLALLTMPLAIWVGYRALTFDGHALNRLIPAMAVNVVVTLLTPVLLAAGLLLAK
jgi:1,4-dihydroxy-2-naphthoate polyprenyltransferase